MRLFAGVFLSFLLAPLAALADGGDKVALSVSPNGAAEAGKPYKATLMLRDGKGAPLPPQSLAVVHTQRLHLLVVDPTLTDYQHLHPEPGKAPGQYVLSFTPKLGGAYRLWADVTPVGQPQAYAKAMIGKEPAQPEVEMVERMGAYAAGLHFKLLLDAPLQSGQSSLARVKIEKSGKPFRQLEPVMGAFAHAVGFSADGSSLVHVHPMGKEPESESERGGPELSFHITPHAPGFMKLFVQIRVGGSDIFVPFGLPVGVGVEPAAQKVSPHAH